MVGNKDFSQYLAEARAKSGAPTSAGPRSAFKAAPKKDDGWQPLSWLVDILSRPMRMVQNAPNTLLDETLKLKQAKANNQPYDVVGGAVNIATSPIRGFWSTDPKDQPTGSELIEKTVDVTNYDNPYYQNVDNNVDPWVKGIGGFAADVVLDPLTWIPGAQYAKAGQMAARGVKTAIAGADAIVAGTALGNATGATARTAVRDAAEAISRARQVVPKSLPEETVPSASILDKLGAPKGSTIAEQYAARNAVDPITKQLDLINPIKPAVVPGDAAKNLILSTVKNQAKAEGRFPMVRNPAEVEAAVGNQYKGLFADFKAANPELAAKFKSENEYWDYLKSHAVDTNARWVSTAKLDPVVKESNKLYASKVLGVPEGGYIQTYRNATHGKNSPELAAAGYSSLDKNMAWDFNASRQKAGQFDGRYTINVKPDEVQGVIGYSKAADEFGLLVSPEVTKIPGRVSRVGDLKPRSVTSYIDDLKTFDRTGGNSPFRFFSLSSQYNFVPLSKELFVGESWADFMKAYNIPKGVFKQKFDELFGAGAYQKSLDITGGYPPQYAYLKEMFIKLPGGKWGFDPRIIESSRYLNEANAAEKYDFVLKMLETAQQFGPQKFMVQSDAAKAFSSSENLKSLLADPAAEAAMKEVLGDAVTTSLAKIKDPNKLSRAIEYLGKVVRGEPVAGSVGKANENLANELHRQYDIVVPGTNIPSAQGTSNVGTEFVAEAKVADAAGADLRDTPWLGGYTEAQINNLIKIFPKFINSKYFLKLEGFPYPTKGGALSTSAVPGKGIHIQPWEFNQMKQYSLLEAVVKNERKAIKLRNEEITLTGGPGSLKIAAGSRASILLDSAIKQSELALRWLDTKGVSAWLGIKNDRIRLYGHQMLRAFNEVDREALALAYLNKETSIPLTNIMDAVVLLEKNPAATDKEILSLLKKKVGNADNFLNSSGKAIYGHIPGKSKPRGIDTRVNKDANGVVKGWYVLHTPEEVAQKTIAMLRGAAPSIKQTIIHNEEMIGSRILAEQKDFTPAIAEEIMNDIADPQFFGKSVRDVADLPTFLGNQGKANFVKPETQASIAKPAVDYWPNDVLQEAQLMVKQVDAYMGDPAKLSELLTKLNIDQASYNFANASDIVKLRSRIYDGLAKDGTIINEAMYADSVFEQAFNDIIMSGHVSKFKRLFNYRAGKQQIIHAYDMTNNAMSHALGSYQSALAKLANSNRGLIPGTDTTFMAQAFRDIAAGKRSSAEIEPLRKELEKFVWTVFGDPRDKNAVGIWQRAGATLEDMQVYMQKAKIPYEIDLTNAETKFAKGGHNSIVEAGMDDWKSWAATVDDPAKFLMDMHWAGFMMHADKTAASLFIAKAGASSPTPVKGFTKIPDRINLFDHPLLGHMPKGTYINDEILQEVNNLEKMILSDFSPKSAAGQWLNNTYIPILGAWKKGVTIYRLGHHIRNLISDGSIQYVQEGVRHFAKASNAAIRTLAAHRSYDDVDWGKMISEIGDLSMPTTGTKLFTFGKQEITTDALFEAASKNGLFSDYTRVEDLFDATTKTKFSSIVDKVSLKDTKVEKLAGGLSSATAHYSRLAHFTQILMKEGKKGKNWEQAVEAAAKKVRRSHPDGMTLTPFERAYMKPFIPFYSWFKQTAPVILEGIVMNPGRFMIYPKASYNAAVALGVDPQSLQDPFPANQMFPSFITNKLTGPVANIDGNYFNAASGFAYADVLNQFVSDPKAGALSMVTPFIKTPGELITGTRWDTGVSIKDYSDYIDSQLPGINYIANFSGTSVTGSIASLLSGQGIDPQYQVSKGNKTVLDQGLSASNWLTGAGLQNISKESYRNLAEIEKRNKAAEEAKRQAGTARSPF